MNRKTIYILLTVFLSFLICSCTLFQEPLDNRTGFSRLLLNTEDHIRKEDWQNAQLGLEDSKKAWEKLKPLLQLDIDHDYINTIEDDFVRLGAYIETKEKADSLSTILLIRESWENIGVL